MSGIAEVEEHLIESNYDKQVASFDELSLKSEILRGMCYIHSYLSPIIPFIGNFIWIR